MSNHRILAIAPSLPKPDQSSGDRRFCAILQLLAKSYDVDLWIVYDSNLFSQETEPYRTQLDNLQVRLLPNQRGIGEPLAKAYYDAVFIEFYLLAEKFIPTIRKKQPHIQVIVDSVDLHFARERLALELGMRSAEQVEQTRQRELSSYRKSDAVIVVSQEDFQILQEEDNQLRIFIIPNIIAIQPELEHTVSDSKELVFVGGFNWHPNVDGIQWFVEKIWMLVREQVPDATITVIGSNPTSEIHELGQVPGVNVLGYVPTTVPYLKRAAVSIAPLRYGGGMKGKVNEAMSLGVPVVTTSAGAQGLNAVPGQDLLVADRPQEFAESVIDLLNNPGRRAEIGLAGQALTAKLCSPDHAEVTLQTLLTTLLTQSKPKLLPLAWIYHIFSFYLSSLLRATPLWNLAKYSREKIKFLYQSSYRAKKFI